MLSFIARRILYMIPTLLAVSMLSFFIIDLPPGDWVTDYISRLRTQDITVNEEAIESLRAQYGFDQPLYIRYLKWMRGVVQGNFGFSWQFNQAVGPLITERMGLTLAVTLAALVFTWVVALPIGIYSAVKQYSVGDYAATFFAFLGVAIPDFLLALVLMYVIFRYTGFVITGLFSDAYINAPWTWDRVVDLMNHMWVPMILLGLSGTAGLIRIMRANLLDELNKPYVMTARAKGLPEWKVILKYPVRLAMNPFVSGVAFIFPNLISGGVILSQVLNLPIAGSMLLTALRAQDMYLAGAFVLLLSSLTVFGTLVSDLMLAWLDPRIRYE
jgi:peptide/nickel transport system permease protein